MAPIRILFVIGTLDVGGAERQFVEIVTRLGPDFEPVVCCLSKGGPLMKELEDAGVQVFVAGFRGVRQRTGLARVRAMFELPGVLMEFMRRVGALRPQVIHGWLLHAYVLGAFAGRWHKVPVVVSSRRSLSHFKQQRPLYRRAERLANGWTDLIICNSEAVREDTLQSEQVAGDKVIVIHNGLQASAYDLPADASMRSSLAAGAGPVVLTIANLIPYKGHAYLLDAWAEVTKIFADATLLLAGDGPARSSLEQQVKRLNLPGVRFLGVRRDVAALLSASDVLVHPSLEEGFCNALLEAMAAGKPVVATRVGGNPEAVVEGETGWLVPARDPSSLARAMLQVLQLPDRGAALGAAGRKRVRERFDVGVMVSEYERRYRDLLRRKESA